MNEVVLEIKGRIPSKKNSLRRMKFGKKVVTIASKEYIDWERTATILFAALVSGRGLPLPFQRVSVDVAITFPDRRRTDMSNKIEGLMDSLVKAGVIEDDNWTIVPDLRVRAVGYDKDHAGARITIKEVE